LSTRLFLDPPADGAWNMAVDEVLLDLAAESGECAWRFYRWSAPTLSLGYFQTYADRSLHAASQACSVVRRLTGGGAILHDHELTYSLVIPSDHPLARARQRLYAMVHTTLIETLADWSIVASLCPAQASDEPFLCFQRRAPGDVLVGHTKIAGSAQRRRRGAVLQHGSILLQRSAAAPELDSIEDLTGRTIPPEQLIEAWTPRIQRSLQLAWNQTPLSAPQLHAAHSLATAKYAAAPWTETRGHQPT
jgi:lipoate-protein ligase A